MAHNNFLIFAGSGNPALAQAISKYIQRPLGKAIIEKFPNGESRIEILESVRGKDIFIIQPTCEPVNDNYMELLLMVDALRRASAEAITVVMPYMGYAKQEKKKSGREPISARLVANMLEQAGISRLVSIDLHAAAIEGFFNVPVEALTSVTLFADYFKNMKDIVVVAPDAGGMKRARNLANALNAKRLAVIDKYRPTYRSASAMNVIGVVEGLNAIIVDDFIDTGGSMVEAIEAVENHNAKNIYVAATHALLTPPAKERLEKTSVKKFVFTDTINIPKERAVSGMDVIGTAHMLGDVITHIMRKHSLHHYRPSEK